MSRSSLRGLEGPRRYLKGSARAFGVLAIAATLTVSGAGGALATPDSEVGQTPVTTTTAPAEPGATDAGASGPADTQAPAGQDETAEPTQKPSTRRGEADRIGTVTTAPPSAAVDVEMPEREPGKAKLSGQELVRAQQHALTVPADQLPELPAGMAARAQREALPEGISEEDAELSERMAMVANSNCQFYVPSPHAVCGEIRNKYNAMGGPGSFLGLPTSPEYQNPGATGYRSEFLHGSIYWSAATGAHPVTPLFMTKWAQHQWEAGWMGYPKTDEIPNGDNIGSRQEFQHANAAIYWNSAVPAPGLSVINGLIRDKWNTLGAQTPGSLLGYPTSDEKTLPDGAGRMNRFERGVIYWSPATGAHPVIGAIFSQWASAGYETSSWGYPIAGQLSSSSGVDEQQFQNGRIYSSGFHIPIAPNLSLSLGIPSSGALQPAIVTDGIALNGPGFSVRFRKASNDGSFELSYTRTNAQSPSSFEALFGLPAGYSLQSNGTRINVLSPTGDLVAGVGLPFGFDANGQLVPVQTSLNGNRMSLQFGSGGTYPTEAVSIAGGGNVLDEWWNTGIQQRQVCEQNPYDCARVRNARGPAYDLSVEAFPDTHNLIPPLPGKTQWRPATEDNRVDAARHCMWNGYMTEGANSDFARQMAGAHELDGRAKPGYKLNGELMDRFNNETGVHVGLRNEGDPDNIGSTCIQYAKNAPIVDPSTIDLSNPNHNSLIALLHPM
ncbi:hypothetical protein AB4Z09_27030 [Rhodococcus sp. TAF43]|uniref:LGFP repeat-containing protein n=1 Tax=Rhodococcus sp. TAF43 TaxID=3237483 RepID=UPI003F970823